MFHTTDVILSIGCLVDATTCSTSPSIVRVKICSWRVVVSIIATVLIGDRRMLLDTTIRCHMTGILTCSSAGRGISCGPGSFRRRGCDIGLS